MQNEDLNTSGLYNKTVSNIKDFCGLEKKCGRDPGLSGVTTCGTISRADWFNL